MVGVQVSPDVVAFDRIDDVAEGLVMSGCLFNRESFDHLPPKWVRLFRGSPFLSWKRFRRLPSGQIVQDPETGLPVFAG